MNFSPGTHIELSSTTNSSITCVRAFAVLVSATLRELYCSHVREKVAKRKPRECDLFDSTCVIILIMNLNEFQLSTVPQLGEDTGCTAKPTALCNDGAD